MAGVGVLICGRHLFDITHGWNGTHPVGLPVVVVTHKAPAGWPGVERFTFVDSVRAAVQVARDLAGEKDVVVASSKIAQQCLDSGLLDEIHLDLVPVLLGNGVPWFENLARAPVRLDNPVVIEGDRVTHLAYSVPGRSSGGKKTTK